MSKYIRFKSHLGVVKISIDDILEAAAMVFPYDISSFADKMFESKQIVARLAMKINPEFYIISFGYRIADGDNAFLIHSVEMREEGFVVVRSRYNIARRGTTPIESLRDDLYDLYRMVKL